MTTINGMVPVPQPGKYDSFDAIPASELLSVDVLQSVGNYSRITLFAYAKGVPMPDDSRFKRFLEKGEENPEFDDEARREAWHAYYVQNAFYFKSGETMHEVIDLVRSRGWLGEIGLKHEVTTEAVIPAIEAVTA